MFRIRESYKYCNKKVRAHGYSHWHYSDLTEMGLETGNWIIIEPQATIDNQGDNWIEQWSLLVAAPLDVD